MLSRRKGHSGTDLAKPRRRRKGPLLLPHLVQKGQDGKGDEARTSAPRLAGLGACVRSLTFIWNSEQKNGNRFF